MDNQESRQGVKDNLAILRALRTFDYDLLRRRCFPLCLAPATTTASVADTQEGTRQ